MDGICNFQHRKFEYRVFQITHAQKLLMSKNYLQITCLQLISSETRFFVICALENPTLLNNKFVLPETL